MVIRYLIEKEFLQIRRNAILPRLFVMLPLVLLIVVPFAANQEIKNLKSVSSTTTTALFRGALCRR